MKHFLIYVCTNKYERTDLTQAKSIIVSTGGNEGNADDHMAYYKDCFQSGEYSALHILVLNLDPANGITEVLLNEYAENPLKKRIVLNEAAKSTVVKRKSATQILAENAIMNADMFTVAGLDN